MKTINSQLGNNQPRTTGQLHQAEARLLEYIRQIKWGSVEISIQNGLPVMVKAAVQTQKLQ